MVNNDGNHIDYFELIPRYLSGNAGIHEVKLLEDWVSASEENKRQFLAFRQAWLLSGVGINHRSFDIDAEWLRLKKNITPENTGKIRQLQVKPKYSIGNFTRYAAAIIIILISSIGIYNYFIKPQTTSLLSQNSIKTNQLPDGSIVTLNQNSALRYPEMKDSKDRKVELDGEAFFDVTRDTNRRFIVSIDNVTVEVLGTEFYIDARKDQDQITVIVRSGSVSVKSDSEKIILGPDESGTYDKDSGILLKSENKDLNYLSWNTGILIFEKTDLERVVHDLNRKFKSNIRIDNPQLQSCQITATFENKSLESIIKIIEKTLKIKSISRGDEIILTGKGCI